MSKKTKKLSRHIKDGTTPRPSELLGKSAPEVETPVAEAHEEGFLELEAEALEVEALEKVETPEPEAETPVAETKEAVYNANGEQLAEAVAEPKEAPSLEDIVANLPDEIREKAQEQLGKLMAQADRNEQAKQFASFNNALLDSEAGVAKWLEALAETHKVSLAGRKITIIYPKGDGDQDHIIPTVSNVPKGKKGNGGNGREGFPTGWGKAELVKEGKVTQTEKSPSALAKSMGLQITGKRTMLDVFENPQEADTKAELEKTYSVDAVKGEHFRVIIK